MDAWTYRRLLRAPFTAIYANLNSQTILTPLEEHKILNGYLCAHIGREGAEIPAMILPFLNIILSQPEIKWEQVVMPLFYESDTVKRTSDAILTRMMNTPAASSRLSKIANTKGEVYYGGQGIILNKNMEPYLLYTVTVSGFEVMHRLSENVTVAKATSLNVRVSPKVFDRNDMISKHIITKMIPTLTYEGILPTQLRGMKADRLLTPKVIVEDLSDWIKRPKRTEHPETFNEDMKNFLSREDIIQDIVGCL